MSYYYHHYHIYHHTQPTATNTYNNNNTSNTVENNNDFGDKSEEFHVYDHCRPIPDEVKSPSRTPSFQNRNGEIYNIYLSFGHASDSMCLD